MECLCGSTRTEQNEDIRIIMMMIFLTDGVKSAAAALPVCRCLCSARLSWSGNSAL